ncbi:MAG: hypothetical protein AB1432_11740 [Bacteroidota bacterium]
MLISSIDIGSNTILLLIAEYNQSDHTINTIFNEYRVPRISKNLKNDYLISDEKISEMLNVLDEYNAIINNHNCKKTICVATNAFRISRNGKQLADNIRIKYGWDVKIIDGEEEAKLSFIGSLPHQNRNEIFTVVDIGGGSTEIINGSSSRILYRKSFNLGAVSIKEKFINYDPHKKEEIVLIENELNNIFQQLVNELIYPGHLIAVAGTPTILSCIKQGLKIYDEAFVDNSVLTLMDINHYSIKFSSMSSGEILNEFGTVVNGREDIILTGTLILRGIMNYLKKEYLHVSSKGLRYGVIMDYVNSLYGKDTGSRIL